MTQKNYVVLEKDTALRVGSGTLEVLATPIAIAMAENTCMIECENLLDQEETTVGIKIEFNHIKPSLVGAQITVISEIKKQDNNIIIISFEMFDDEKKIGYGEHHRAIVKTDLFLSRIR